MSTVPAPREEIVIGCEGNRRALTIINGRYVRWRCTQKRCRHEHPAPPGVRHRIFHIADSLTGRLVRTEYEVHEGRVIRPEGE